MTAPVMDRPTHATTALVTRVLRADLEALHDHLTAVLAEQEQTE